MRVDKLLWFLRLSKTRGLAQGLIEEGHVRIDGRQVERAHHKVSVGNVLTMPHGQGVRIIEVLALPNRRGPASEAQSCYRVLDGSGNIPLAASRSIDGTERELQP
jgi:ribosome-associated heat shock protein Hsp15